MSPEALQAYIAKAANVDDARIVGADAEPGNWPAHGRATIENGSQIYHKSCAVCHGMLAIGQSNIPDLRYSGQVVHDVFQEIVLGGMLEDRGMASFADHLKPADAKVIEAYIVAQAHKAWDEQRAKKAN